MMKQRKLYAQSLLLALCMVLVPEMAWAYTLQCVGGLPVNGTEVFPGVDNCTIFSVYQPFSSLNCYFQQILNEVVKRMYCGIQFQLGFALQAAILLFVIVYALMFMMGLAQLTAKELTTNLIKIALIWSFATNAAWGIGLAFYFLVGGIESVVTWIIQVFFGGMEGRSFIAYIDFLIYNQLTGGLTESGVKLVGFFATIAILMFPVFLLFLVFMMTVTAALTRTVVGYLLGLSAIAFLIALGPIFISFALFKSTFTFFDSWFRYLVSFSLQIILIFAAVALWLYVMSLTGTFFLDLAAMIVPYTDQAHSQASFAIFNDTWGICFDGAQTTPSGALTGKCDGGDLPLPPSAYSQHGGLISWVTINLITLGTLVYAFDVLLRMMPNLARQLAGPAFAPQLGGGQGFGSVSMPGFSAVGQLKEKALFQAKSGVIKGFARWQGGAANALNAQAAAAANQRNPAQQARDQAARLPGGGRAAGGGGADIDDADS